MKWIAGSLLVLLLSIASLILFAKVNTRPYSFSTEGFVRGKDLEIAFIGDSIATDMVRTYRFLPDAYRLITPSHRDCVTGHDMKDPFGLVDWISKHRPVLITNYSRPGTFVFSREDFNDPPAWQRWAGNIPSLGLQVDRFLKSRTRPQIVALWIGHMELLYWNSFQGRFREKNNEEIRQWVTHRFSTEFERQLIRLIDWAKASSPVSIVVFGLLDWPQVTRLADEVQRLKATQSGRFVLAEERKDPAGQIELWRAMNQALKNSVERFASESNNQGVQITYSSMLETIDLTTDDLAEDGIHAAPSGHRKIAKLLFEGLKKNLPNTSFDPR